MNPVLLSLPIHAIYTSVIAFYTYWNGILLYSHFDVQFDCEVYMTAVGITGESFISTGREDICRWAGSLSSSRAEKRLPVLPSGIF